MPWIRARLASNRACVSFNVRSRAHARHSGNVSGAVRPPKKSAVSSAFPT